MIKENKNECQCSQATCGCAAASVVRCNCSEVCTCARECRCDDDCACASKQ